MNQKLKDLYDKSGKIHSQMVDAYRLVSERKDGLATADETRQFDAWDAELVQIENQIKIEKRMEELKLKEEAQAGIKHESEGNKEKKYNEAASKSERRAALDKANKVGYSSLSDAERQIVDTEVRDSKVFEKFLRYGKENLNAEEVRVLNQYKESRAQSIGTPSAGGYTVPEGFSGFIIEKMKYISAVMNWANILNTDTGNVIPFPINDDTSNTGELIGENSDLSSSSADLTFSVYNLNAYKMSSKMVKVSSELLQDNGVNLEAYLGEQLANRVARISNSYYTTGTGSSQPQGYITGATQGSVSASATAFTSTELIGFQDTLDQAYQNMPKTGWAMHQLILNAIKKLTIGTNYNSQLWVPSFRDGAPSTILGKPYFLNNAMASTLATGNKIIAYGDWDKFCIRMVNSFALSRLSERYAEYDQVAFFGLARTDSFVMDNTAIKYFELT